MPWIKTPSVKNVKKNNKTNKNIYQIKISLLHLDPIIWRRILVPANFSFEELHYAIQDTFAWEGSHMHQFFTALPFASKTKYQVISLPHPERDKNELNESKTKLDAFLVKAKDKVFYEYDFGDSWMHEISLEKILPPDPKVEYPVLLNGEFSAPPEDCGGPAGYIDLILAIKDPKNPEHENMLEWLGLDSPKDFKPEYFDKDEVEFRMGRKIK